MNGQNPNNLNNSENNFGAMTLGNTGGNTTSGQPNEVETLNPTPMPKCWWGKCYTITIT